MEMGSEEAQNGGWWEKMKGKLQKAKEKAEELGRNTKKLAKEDPRRITHSVKMGVALTVVSLFYYFEPLYDGFGASAMWAILTVVVVLEFSVGATLGRGLNRVMATFLAGALGFGAHFLATLAGDKAQPVLLAVFVFFLAAATTFVRFFPRIKARYDYGFLIFILTFCLVSVSGYRDEDILLVGYRRAITILIGSFIALLVCVLICPVWAGDDLHSLIANNIEILGTFLESFGSQCCGKSENRESEGVDLQGFKAVLTSRQTEQALVNFARWEPRHGKFKFGHPWKQYSKIGSLTRQCAYRLESLNTYLTSDIHTPLPIGEQLKESCMKMSMESGRALKELALGIRTMSQPSSPQSHIENSKNEAKNLKAILKIEQCDGIDLLEIVPAAAVASLLIDSIGCIQRIEECVRELASIAHFKCIERTPSSQHKLATPTPTILSGHYHVVTVD